MKDLKESPVNAAQKKKSVKTITVSQPTVINKLQVKPTTAKITSTKPNAKQQPVTKPAVVNQIVIEKIIVHILDPKEPIPTLSNKLLNPAIYTEAFELVRRQISNILHNKRTRKAIFTNHGASTVCGFSKIACTYPSKFIDASQELAKLLHTQIKSIPNTGKCDLVVCQYHIEKKLVGGQHEPEKRQNKRPKRQLAILKLGMSYGLRNVVNTLGGTSVKEVILENSKPFTFRELQKGALVQSCNLKSPCNLLILDNQTKPFYQKKVAIYFKDNYLESEFASSSIQLTRYLYESLIEIENDLVKDGLYDDVEHIHELQVYFFKIAVFNLKTWMKGSNLPASFIMNVDPLLKTYMKGIATFDIDQDTYRKDFEQARFLGSNGLSLQVPQDFLSMICLPKLYTKSKKPANPAKPKKPILIMLETNDWTRLK